MTDTINQITRILEDLPDHRPSVGRVFGMLNKVANELRQGRVVTRDQMHIAAVEAEFLKIPVANDMARIAPFLPG